MNRWVVCDEHFKYQLSDLTIFNVSLRLQCRSAKLLDEQSLLELPPPPIEELQPGSQGFLIRALPITGEFPNISQRNGYIYYTSLKYLHCYIDLNQSFDSYQKSFSSKTRSTISRKIKKFAEYCGGTISWATYKKPEEMQEFFRYARAVSILTYQERLLDAGLPGSEDFIRQAESLAAQNRVRAYILFDGTRPISYLYCPINEGVLMYAYLGYDPEYAKMSVGTVLQWLALEQIFNEACFRAFDFSEGQGEHKRLFATHQCQCANLFMVKNSPKNKAIIYSHYFINSFFEWIGAILDRLGLKKKLKRLLRSF